MYWQLFLYSLVLIIGGAVTISRGRTLIKDAGKCEDLEERLALIALGQRRVRIGVIIIGVTIVATLIFLLAV